MGREPEYPLMSPLRVAVAIAGLTILQACTVISIDRGAATPGTAVDHTLSGIAYRTFAAPVATLRLAALETLSQMDMSVTQDRKRQDGWKIAAKTEQRAISVELEPLAPGRTRMRVIVRKGGFFFKDRATGSEIITQTARILDQGSMRAGSRTE